MEELRNSRQLRDTARIYCFGGNDSGQLGLGNDSPCLAPTLVEELSNRKPRFISCGSHHSVACNDEGELFTWGNNEYGQLGRSGRTMIPQQVMALETMRIIHVAAGDAHTAVVDRAGDMYTMGRNGKGQLGKGDWEDGSKPKKVKNVEGYKFSQVACGGQTTLALTTAGEVLACGEGTMGQMGSGDIISYHTLTPIPVLFGTPIKQLAVGVGHCLALTVSGSVFCWGDNKFGQLGLGDTAGRRHPFLNGTLHMKHIKQISCGSFHSAAVSETGMLYTWGQGSAGQLGHGSLSHETIPQVVFELLGSKVEGVGCGRMHTIASVLSNDRARIHLFGWGYLLNIGLGGRKPTITTTESSSPSSSSLSSSSGGLSSGGGGGSGNPNAVSVPTKIAPEEFSNKEGVCVSSIFTGVGDHTFIQTTTPLPHTASPTLPTLSYFSLSSLRELFASKSSSLELQQRISVVFSSPMCMNASFLKSGGAHYDTGDMMCGIDMPDLQEAYRLILSQAAENSALLNAFGNATARLVAKLVKIPNPSRLTERLRVFLMVLENPLLWEPVHSHVVLERLCRAFLALNEETTDVLSRWWQWLSPEHFARAVKVFSSFLTFLLTQKNAPDSPIISATLTLDLLRKINEKEKNIIAYESFYNDAVSEKTNLAKDYKTWRESSSSVFCFCRYPFLLNPDAKSKIIRIDAKEQMGEQISAAYISTFLANNPSAPCLLLVVRRDHLLEDTIHQLLLKRDDLKKPLKVVFVGEEAIDQGGVSKEFFQLVVKNIFDPAYGMWVDLEETRRMWFNVASSENSTEFGLIGTILGLAIYNGVILPVKFPRVLFKKLLKKPIGMEDVKEAFPEIGKNLEYLLQYDGDVEQAFLLNFTVSYDCYGTIITKELKHNGANIPVTENNRAEYVKLYVNWLLNDSVAQQFEAFAQGFSIMCTGAVLGLFNPTELEVLICGSPEWNFHELEKTAEYKQPYHPDHPVIRSFWKVVHSYPPELQRKLLAFTTGSDCVPIQGLSKLKFIIQRAGDDASRLPAAHTCFNLLDLPEYPNEEVLNEKLQLALQNTQGFGLV